MKVLEAHLRVNGERIDTIPKHVSVKLSGSSLSHCPLRVSLDGWYDMQVGEILVRPLHPISVLLRGSLVC